MKEIIPVGHNRTGISNSEGRVDDMQRRMDEFAPSSTGSAHGAGMIRVAQARQSEPLGSIPSGNGLDLSESDQFTALMLDKLGERLAFEAGGTRLYEALVSKHEAYGSFDGGPSRNDLIEILNQEHRHFHLLAETIRNMDGDPTVVTPSADLVANMSAGIVAVIVDPRVTLLQSLEGILVAELADNEGWATLTALLRAGGDTELARECESAQQTEEEHLRKVRRWIEAGYSGAMSAPS